ncbi:hypothetical protein, partial [Deinococcus alpinitundrae]|uniref:hypothetical protein n=1 Tax=Deinococcus alpinitundrae TaxID=468913 RepID=UPI001ED8F0F5
MVNPIFNLYIFVLCTTVAHRYRKNFCIVPVHSEEFTKEFGELHLDSNLAGFVDKLFFNLVCLPCLLQVRGTVNRLKDID